jgi:hypothetical protein
VLVPATESVSIRRFQILERGKILSYVEIIVVEGIKVELVRTNFTGPRPKALAVTVALEARVNLFNLGREIFGLILLSGHWLNILRLDWLVA